MPWKDTKCNENSVLETNITTKCSSAYVSDRSVVWKIYVPSFSLGKGAWITCIYAVFRRNIVRNLESFLIRLEYRKKLLFSGHSRSWIALFFSHTSSKYLKWEDLIHSLLSSPRQSARPYKVYAFMQWRDNFTYQFFILFLSISISWHWKIVCTS